MRTKGMFWAILFISVGLILLLQNIFGINIPVLRILFGIFLVYLGVKVIAGAFGHRMHYFRIDRVSTDTESIFTSGHMKAKDNDGKFNKKFATVFGTSKLDLTGLSQEELAEEIKIDNAFGRTLVMTDKNMPIKAHVEAGFASVNVRGQKVVSFGDADFQTPDYSSDKPALKLDINAAFGEVVVE